MKPHMPELEDGYRWKIDPTYEDSWSAVKVKLQKKTWLGWMTLRSRIASTFFTRTSLEDEVEKAAEKLWDQQFKESPAKKMSGVYYGDNQYREK